ncbi:MAG: diaminopimelate epimerase [Capsulimonadales bacterium]|nr:diaminopimelate epimerase [Capsulimonadales bacterium]
MTSGSGRPFAKMQAVGNDFVVVDATAWPPETDWPPIALDLCDRHTGIGGDGLLVVLPSDVADVRMRMFNPDGTEDMCGNGLRCVIRFARERSWFTTDEGMAEAVDGLHQFSLRNADTTEPEGRIAVRMAEPCFAPEAIPREVTPDTVGRSFSLTVTPDDILVVTPVNTGSTHTVIFVPTLPDNDTFFRISPEIECHPLFPERTSVLWTVVEHAGSATMPPRVRLRIWERGVGETLGCGTGACAASVVSALEGRINAFDSEARRDRFRCDVVTAGGTLSTAFDREQSPNPDIAGFGPVTLIGPATVTFTGRLSEGIER